MLPGGGVSGQRVGQAHSLRFSVSSRRTLMLAQAGG
jgi:hypothetical protein